MAHQPPPAGWPQISSGLFYRDASAAIDWLCDAFGFEIRLKVEGEPGEIIHSELMYGQGMIMVSGSVKTGAAVPEGKDFKRIHASPLDLGGRVNQSLCMFVDDVDAHCAHARARGAAIFAEPATHDYDDDYWSDRAYGATDCEGHQWWFMHRIREEKPK